MLYATPSVLEGITLTALIHRVQELKLVAGIVLHVIYVEGMDRIRFIDSGSAQTLSSLGT